MISASPLWTELRCWMHSWDHPGTQQAPTHFRLAWLPCVQHVHWLPMHPLSCVSQSPRHWSFTLGALRDSQSFGSPIVTAVVQSVALRALHDHGDPGSLLWRHIQVVGVVVLQVRVWVHVLDFTLYHVSLWNPHGLLVVLVDSRGFHQECTCKFLVDSWWIPYGIDQE
jgi:hypothetical protein